MEQYPRLTRAEVINRLRAHARAYGFVSVESLHQHDPIAQRSIVLHFVGLDAARHAAGVPGPPYQKPRRKTGPKPGGPPGRIERIWSRERIIKELKRLHSAGQVLTRDALERAGHLGLIR